MGSGNCGAKNDRSSVDNRVDKCVSTTSKYEQKYFVSMSTDDDASADEVVSKDGETRVYKCPFCAERSTCKDKIQAHLQLNHGCAAKKKTHSCKVCGKIFAHRRNLGYHMRTHDDTNKTFSCGECNKKFRSSSNFKHHLQVHTGEQPFECPVCSKKYARAHGVKLHMRSHTGERPFHCDKCQKKFARAEYLRKHMKLHNDQKLLVCHICKKTFHADARLKLHIMRSHSNSLTVLSRDHSASYPVLTSSVDDAADDTIKCHFRLKRDTDPNFQCNIPNVKLRKQNMSDIIESCPDGARKIKQEVAPLKKAAPHVLLERIKSEVHQH